MIEENVFQVEKVWAYAEFPLWSLWSQNLKGPCHLWHSPGLGVGFFHIRCTSQIV